MASSSKGTGAGNRRNGAAPPSRASLDTFVASFDETAAATQALARSQAEVAATAKDLHQARKA
jgi:hypothetical protein